MRFASCERRNPDARFRPCFASSRWSLLGVVKEALAWEKSGDTSTSVMVIMPTRGSRSSRCTSSESSRWIRSPSFCGRPLERFTKGLLQTSRNLQDLEHLELVAFLEIREVLQRHAALEARLDLAHVVLEALERVDLAGMDDDVVAQHADLRIALDQALLHVAAGDGADLGDAEHLLHLDQPE